MNASRRRLLAAGTLGTLSVLAGCSTGLFGGGTDESGPSLRLGEVAYANLHDAPHTLDVVVSVASEIVYWHTLDLASAEHAPSKHTAGTLDISSPNEPVEYAVLARVDGGETARTTSAAGIQWSSESVPDAERPCSIVRVRITASGAPEVENWEAEQAVCGG